MNLMSIYGCHAFPCKYGHGLELFIQTWNLCDQKKKKQPVRLVIPSRFCMQNMERVGFQSLVQKVLSGPILDQSQLGNGLRPQDVEGLKMNWNIKQGKWRQEQIRKYKHFITFFVERFWMHKKLHCSPTLRLVHFLNVCVVKMVNIVWFCRKNWGRQVWCGNSTANGLFCGNSFLNLAH